MMTCESKIVSISVVTIDSIMCVFVVYNVRSVYFFMHFKQNVLRRSNDS